MSPFVTRLAVALAGLPIVLAVAYIGGWALFALVALAAALALHELYTVARSLRPLVLAGYGGVAAGLIGAMLGGPVWLFGGLLVGFPLAFVFAAVAETRQSTTVTLGTTIVGAAWIGLGLGLILLLREQPLATREGRYWAMTTLVIIFTADTAAYLAGRVAGRHKMSPVISPGKTWEGFVFGTSTGIFASWIAFYKQGLLEQWESVALGAAVVLAGVVGDLFESLVKRDLGVKDTGGLLLGHGGMLDRIDSLLFAAPAAYFTLLALGEI